MFDIFLIFAQNIDCGYSLEPPRIPQFCYIKVGFKGIYITRACFHDGCRQTSSIGLHSVLGISFAAKIMSIVHLSFLKPH